MRHWSNSDGVTQITLTAHPTFDVGPGNGVNGVPVLPGFARPRAFTF